MKTLLKTLLGVALLATICSGTFLSFNNGQSNDLQAASLSPYITFIDDSLINNLVLQLQGQTSSSQLQIIQSFVFQQRKFLNSASIVKILAVLKVSQSLGEYPLRNTAISVMKPYIAPLSTNEAIEIIQIIDQYDGLACGILTTQVYDLYGNTDNQRNLSIITNNFLNPLKNQIILPQATKQFQTNFLISFEGQHVGYLIDQSDSMNSIAFTNADGTTVTRYEMLKSFFQNFRDINQNFLAFSYLVLGNKTSQNCDACSTGGYDEMKAFQALTNISSGGGSKDLYLKLSELASKPYSSLSEVHIWSDGLVPSGTQGVNDFIKLIDSINAQRRIKIRINTVSFLVGGNEDASTRNAATTLLQTLADYTNGTFIQIQPNMK